MSGEMTWVQKKIEKHGEEKLRSGRNSPPTEKVGSSFFDPSNIQTEVDLSGKVIRSYARFIVLPKPDKLRKLGVETYFGVVPMKWMEAAAEVSPGAYQAAVAVIAQLYAHRFPKSYSKEFDPHRKIKDNHHTFKLATKYWFGVKPYVRKKRSTYIRQLAKAGLLSAEIRKGRSVIVSVYIDSLWISEDVEAGPDEVLQTIPMPDSFRYNDGHEGTATTTEGG